MFFICIDHRYIDQLGTKACPECQEILKEDLE